MSPRLLASILVIVGSLLANILFWGEKFGLNVLIFSLFVVGAQVYLFPESRGSRWFRWSAIGFLVASLMVVLHNSGAAKFAFMVTFCTTTGFAHIPDLRRLLYSLLHYLVNIWYVPRALKLGFSTEKSIENTGSKRRTALSWVFKSIVPLLIAMSFYVIYYLSNGHFAKLSDQFWAQIGRLFTLDLPFDRIFFFFFQLFLVGGALLKGMELFNPKAGVVPAFMQRIKPARATERKPTDNVHRFDMNGLRKESQQSVLTLVMVNLLLLVVNTTDIWFNWFDFQQQNIGDLRDFVHFGTYTLILSIFMAMLVLFYIYRGNLNFYAKGQLTQKLAYFWLVQNVVLVISVIIRNWHYIHFYALAYKRIGVFIFLTLVLVGLYTLFLKIKDKRTFAWLMHTNAWAVFAMLILNACIPWDQWITRYNLHAETLENLDSDYLLTGVSDKNLYILEASRAQFAKKSNYDEARITHRLVHKRQAFEAQQSQYSWLSWNYADALNKRK
jgi:Domain of unknown function (DUF4173)